MNETTPASNGTPDIGSLLRQARTRRGQSLEAVQQQTRIPKKLLDALESNRFDEFPATVYLRGFLKNYCDHLDVEFDPLWAQIDPNKAKAAAQPEAATAKTEKPEAHAEPPEPEGPWLVQSSLFPFLLGGLLLVGALAVWQLGRRPSSPAAPVHQLPSALAPVEAPKEMTLKISVKNDTWLQLSADGVLRFQGRAPAGLSQEWKASDFFLLRTKDPAGLGVELDGKPVVFEQTPKTSSGDYRIVRP